MANPSCELFPKVNNNEDSILYKELLKLIADRPLTNLIYAAYSQQGVAAQMDSFGYKQNKQGQHSGKDVYTFFDVATMLNEGTLSGTNQIAKAAGAMDSYGNLTEYTDARQALNVAAQINSSSKGAVAFVSQVGDKFNVNVVAKDSFTQTRSMIVKEKQQVWDVVTQAFNNVGVDINAQGFDSALVNAFNGEAFVNWMGNIKNTRNSLIPKNDLKTLLQISENTQQVTRLKQMFGSLDDVAQAIYDAYRNRTTATMAQRQLMDATITNSKNFNGLDLASLRQEIADIKQNMQTEPEATIQDTIDDLHRKYGININDIHLQDDKIKSLERAAQEAVITLNRQLNQLKAKEGITQEVKDLEQVRKTLIREIENNKYYAGVLGFLEEANNQLSNINNLLHSIPQSGTKLGRAIELAKSLQEAMKIMEGYEPIIKALSNVEKLISTEKINNADRQRVKDEATNILESFKEYKSMLEELRESFMIDTATAILGDKTADGMSVVNLVRMAETDASITDWLYAMGRCSKPLIAAMGNIVQGAQTQKDTLLRDFAVRVRREDNKLRKAGFTSEFMYEDNGYIISDIDWNTFNKEKIEAIKKAKRAGLKGFALEEAIQAWEDAHMEDRMVDFKNQRTEKVPDSRYRKAFPTLKPAQADYYKAMMQIKGELGTMLPYYAQRQFMPPQIRRGFIDAWKSAKSIKDLYRAIKNKMLDFVTIREDDPFYEKNGIINGQDYGIVAGALDNTPYRQIPIFFVNKIQDQRELLKDFSGAIQALAGTAINYHVMSQVKDSIELMGDFIKNKNVAATRGGKNLVESVEDSAIRIFKDLTKMSKNGTTAAIIDGFVARHLYGVKIKGYSKWNKFWRTLLTYSSSRNLSVNVPGMISNWFVGELQMIVEAGGFEFYNPADYMWASAKVFGDNTIGAPGRIMDFMTNNVNSESVLLAQLFDPLMESYDDLSRTRYYRGPFSHILSRDYMFIGYGMGEHMLHFTNMYAVLHHEKIKINGKKANLYDAFSVGNKKDGNSELIINPNATYTNEAGQDVPIDDAYLEKIKNRIKYVNQTTHGSMNSADVGLIHQYMLGKYVMNLRQWMVEHYSRRFRQPHWDSTLNEWREGFYYTVYRYMCGWAKDLFNYQTEAALHWNEMDDGQKANIRRALTEQLVLGLLLSLSFALGEPEDHKKEFWMRMWIYQVKRAIVDVLGSTPYGVPKEMNTLINSPIAATNTINAIMYPVYGLSDIDDTIKTGKHKGENRYLRNMEKYFVPYNRQIERLQDLPDDESMFSIFNKSNMQ